MGDGVDGTHDSLSLGMPGYCFSDGDLDGCDSALNLKDKKRRRMCRRR